MERENKRPKNAHMQFDKTKGYPGEGPSIYVQDITAITMAIQHLQKTNTLVHVTPHYIELTALPTEFPLRISHKEYWEYKEEFAERLVSLLRTLDTLHEEYEKQIQGQGERDTYNIYTHTHTAQPPKSLEC